jgi:hypothetical protein
MNFDVLIFISYDRFPSNYIIYLNKFLQFEMQDVRPMER